MFVGLPVHFFSEVTPMMSIRIGNVHKAAKGRDESQ